MKMPNITPGPWSTGNTDSLLFGAKRGNGTEPIGFVYGPSFPERSDVGQRALATTTAIAALPDLLEALWICHEHNRLHFGDSHNTVIKSGAALLKAGCTDA